ncbi:MAG: DUF2784 domain-containing protein [Gemmatales bacterium]|nr:DUF2784 domain-containing protein [Gemmatales bacterium]MDW7995000.1 DUF2784 domain-containing protein [Gemmatales bacterium]
MSARTAAFLANVILLVHFALVAFVVAGLLLTLLGGCCRWSWVRNFWFRATHLALVVVIVLEAIFGIVCPLTTWESQLRALAGDEGVVELERQGFIIYYARKILFFPDELAWDAQTLMWIYIGFGAVVVLSVVLVPPRWPEGWRRRVPPVSSPV